MEGRTFDPIQIQSNLSSNYGVYINFVPAEILRKYICCYWISPLVDTKAMDLIEVQEKEIVVPDGCIDMLFSSTQSDKDYRNIIVGTMSRPIYVDMQHGEIQTFGIRFYPGGVHAFVREDAAVFTDRIEMIDNIQKNIFTDLGKRLNQINNVYEKINFTNHYLISRLIDSIPYEDKFQNILYNIHNTKGIVRVKDIALCEAISEKQVTRIIKNRVGVSAKVFINIIRFQNVLKNMNSNKQVKIAEVAVDAGYYDQSHFTHDFYEYSGMTPLEYIKQKPHP